MSITDIQVHITTIGHEIQKYAAIQKHTKANIKIWNS